MTVYLSKAFTAKQFELLRSQRHINALKRGKMYLHFASQEKGYCSHNNCDSDVR